VTENCDVHIFMLIFAIALMFDMGVICYMFMRLCKRYNYVVYRLNEPMNDMIMLIIQYA